MKTDLHFEQGPIRPPNEARSLLLRFTRNCPWNQCLFCPVYKRRKFSLRSVDEIKQDIQTARAIADDILQTAERITGQSRVDDRVINTLFNQTGGSDSYRSVALWLYYNTRACFLQDADNLIMKTDDLVATLEFLRQNFPEINRITTYSRSKTVTRKSVESLKKIRTAGLNRIHIGLESGCDAVLKLMKKGVSAAQQIDAGQRLRAAGMEVSEYVMPGLGGQALWREHAQDTAHVLNQINPHFIRLRSLRIPGRVPLSTKVQDGSFLMPTDDMTAREIRLFIQSLEGITSTVTSDHIMNLLEEVSGTLPEDKPRMLDVIDAYLNLPETERLIFRVGRRSGNWRGLQDMRDDTVAFQKIKSFVEDTVQREGIAGVEQMITASVDRYI